MFRALNKVLEPFTKKFWHAAVGEASAGGSSSGTSGRISDPTSTVTKEQKLTNSLRERLPGITFISIEDISGGCGAMYEVNIEAKEFKGLSIVKQHRLVTDCLKDEITSMHGIRIHTTAPDF